MVKLSPQTLKLLKVIFPASLQVDATVLLAEECANNLPMCENSDEKSLERIRFAALKVSHGEINRLKAAINLAKLDWRDLLLWAEFARDAQEHKQWARAMLLKPERRTGEPDNPGEQLEMTSC